MWQIKPLVRNSMLSGIGYQMKMIEKRSGEIVPDGNRSAKTSNKKELAILVIIWYPEYESLRLDGRIRSDNLTRDEQFPILLDKTGVLAPLLIRDAFWIF